MEDQFLDLKFTKTYPGFRLEVDTTFPASITAIFGPSGSGKTTLLNCIAGLSSPDNGHISLYGNTLYSSVGKVQVPSERRQVGYMFQDGLLFPHMTVMENICYGFKLTPRDQQRIAPGDLVELMELGELLHRHPDRLSGGERQRVALARALATSPRLLLLDEPLTSLNLTLRGRILRYLKTVHQQLSIPMVYVSHSISEVLAVADYALLLAAGKQVAFDVPRRLLVEPQVQQMMGIGVLENLLDVEVKGQRAESGMLVVEVGENSLYVLHPPFGQDDIVPGDTILVAIRAGDIMIALDPPARISAQNILSARITDVQRTDYRVLVFADCGMPLVAEVTPEAATSLGLHRGQDAYLIIKSSSIMVLD